MLDFLLYPFAVLYDGVTSIRNWMYDCSILQSYTFDIPTICIGNLAVGGTGKTPHTEYLIRLFQAKGMHVAVLSRGYKRKTKGFVLADDSSSVADIGDEPYQMFHKFQGLTVAVDADRCEGIQRLQDLDERPDVILLDDAFQHRRVQPTVSILLTDRHRLYSTDWLMPMGRLRESRKGHRRADIVIVTKCTEAAVNEFQKGKLHTNLKLEPQQQLYFSRIKYGKLSNGISLDQLKDYSVLLITGIANPQPLEEELGKYTDFNSMRFGDHHNFTQADITGIRQAYEALEGSQRLIVTTEKDYTRLAPLLHTESLCSLPIEVEIMNGEQAEFEDRIISSITKEVNSEE